jgi:hypothetical protein
MLRELLSSFESYLSRAGVIGLAEGALGVLAFGGALSAVLGDSSAKLAAAVAVLLATLGLIVLLAASRAQWQRRSELYDHLVTRYCTAFTDDNASSWQLTQWIESHRIDGNGDSTVLITVRAVVTCSVLRLYRFRVGAGWNQPEKLRRRVDVQVRSLVLDGIGGARCDLTKHWLDDGRLEVLVHFPSPVRQGSEFRVLIESRWPARSTMLVKDRLPEDFCVQVKSPLDRLEYTVVLPVGEEAFYDPIGFRPDDQRFLLVSCSDGTGRQEISLTGKGIADTGRTGFRLDLKRKALR